MPRPELLEQAPTPADQSPVPPHPILPQPPAPPSLSTSMLILLLLLSLVPPALPYSAIPLPHPPSVFTLPPSPPSSNPGFSPYLVPLSPAPTKSSAPPVPYALLDMPPAPPAGASLPFPIPLIVLCSDHTHHSPRSNPSASPSELAELSDPANSTLTRWLDFCYESSGVLPKVLMHRFDLPTLYRPHVSHVLDGTGPWYAGPAPSFSISAARPANPSLVIYHTPGQTLGSLSVLPLHAPVAVTGGLLPTSARMDVFGVLATCGAGILRQARSAEELGGLVDEELAGGGWRRC